MIGIKLWIVTAGCLTFVSTQGLPGFHLPSIMHVERNWYVTSTAPIGTFVTKAYRERTGDERVIFGLETSGPEVPFSIDPDTGVVTVNNTLSDKETRSYSLWVTATTNDGGSIPQRTEVYATITDKSGTRRNPHPPQLPPFPFTVPPKSKTPFPLFMTPPKTTSTPTPMYTKATEYFIEETVPDTTTIEPPKVEDEDRDKIITIDEEVKTTVNKTSEDSNAVGNESPLTVISLVAISGLVAIVAGVLFFIWKKNQSPKPKSKKEDMSKDSSGIVLQDASLNIWERPRAYSNRYECWDNGHLQLSDETSITKEEPRDEWEFPRHRLRIFNILGEGAFGQVWRAQAIDIDGQKGDTTVAVKTLKENASEKEKMDLMMELAVMKSLGTHPNVVRLIACCTEKEPTLVIMEYINLGKLQQFLRDSRAERHYGNTHGGSQFLTSRDLTLFAFHVARGMEFLSSKGIIHRDLAARNVLITEERVCKVADFGFARDLAGRNIYERKSDGSLPIRWMPPESIYDGLFSDKSDIWSFGVLVWEIVTLGSTPYPGLSANDVMIKVRDGYRLEKPEHCRRELYNIMYYCWESLPENRPNFKEVVSMLEKLVFTDTDYIELERFPHHSYYNVMQHMDGEKV